MSSADEDLNEPESSTVRTSKKRRVQRACDVCRRKKIRCDGSQMPGNRCSNCIAYNYECSYVEAARKRGPPKGYVESLEIRLEKMEGLLRRLCPDADFTQELGAPLIRANFAREGTANPTSGNVVSASGVSGTNSASPSALAGPVSASSPPPAEVEILDPSDDEYGQNQMLLLQQTFSEMSVSYRFFGKSSGVRLVQTALDLKSEYSGISTGGKLSMNNRRPEFWSLHPWERSTFRIEGRKYDFPEPDLMKHLIELYFVNINIFLPLIHRPTFEAALADDLHSRDEAFGALVLCIVAVASRYSNDPRVILEGTNSWQSSGWKWFIQMKMVRKSLLAAPCLYDLQMYSLACLFLQGCSAPQACWTMIGIGLRLAQDVGAHRKKVYGAKLSIEDELWKRAFWTLVVLDRLMSASLGRPCAIQEEDFDLDLPVECDDEYWTPADPEQAFKQPADKPSQVSYFISFLKLNQILAFALRTIYSINKSKILLGFVGQQWEQHIVAELDSALNKWIDSVPDHLRWDPTREDETFFLQSASLYSTYYHLQILVHRPFIPSPRKPSPLSFPSLAICTNAARSCSHVVDIQRRRAPGRPFPHFQLPAFTAGIVLLLSIWGVKRSGVAIDPMKEMEDVHKCMQVLKDAEGRWHAAGRLWDVLYELASVGDLPLPAASPSVKRGRDAEDGPAQDPSPVDSQSSSGSPSYNHRESFLPRPSLARATSPTQRGAAPPVSPSSSIIPPTGYGFTNLPIHSYDLGRMPMHSPATYLPEGASVDPLTSVWYMHPQPGVSPSPSFVDTPQPQQQPPPPPPPQHEDPRDSMFHNETRFPGFGYHDGGLPNPMGPGRPMEMFDSLLQGLPQAPTDGSPEGDSMNMWSTVPSGYELEDWDSYIASVSGLAHPHSAVSGPSHPPPGSTGAPH